jgi:hypothetical protein
VSDSHCQLYLSQTQKKYFQIRDRCHVPGKREVVDEAILVRMPNLHELPTVPPLEPFIFTLRGHRIILDADLAKLYGVTTKALNQALRRNLDRFPSDFAFQLIAEEIRNIRSHVIDNPPQSGENEEKTNWSQSVASSRFETKGPPEPSLFSRHDSLHRGRVYLPWAFTEHGALMAANILRSQLAAHMSVYVVRAFVKLRQGVLENEGLSRRMAEAELALREHDAALADVYDKLEPLLEPPPESHPKRVMGFTRDESG